MPVIPTHMPTDLQRLSNATLLPCQNGMPTLAQTCRAAQRGAQHLLAGRPLSHPCHMFRALTPFSVEVRCSSWPFQHRLGIALHIIGANELTISVTPAFTGIAVIETFMSSFAGGWHEVIVDVGAAVSLSPIVVPTVSLAVAAAVVVGVAQAVNGLRITHYPCTEPWTEEAT